MKQKLLFLFAFFFVTTSAWAEGETPTPSAKNQFIKEIVARVLSHSEIEATALFKGQGKNLGGVAQFSLTFAETLQVSPADYSALFNAEPTENIKDLLPLVEVGGPNIMGSFTALKQTQENKAEVSLKFQDVKTNTPASLVISFSDSPITDLFKAIKIDGMKIVGEDILKLETGPLQLNTKIRVKGDCSLYLLKKNATDWQRQKCIADITLEKDKETNEYGFSFNNLEIGDPALEGQLH